MTTPDDIIRAFDDCLDYIFGRALGRDNPHATDAATARKWLADGLTLVIAVIVFHEQMNWMHEKFLRFGNAKDRSYLPSALKVFNDNIETAIRRHQNGGQLDEWDRRDSQWRARVKGWARNPRLWRQDMWGPPPGQPGCRLPRSVLVELKEAA